MPWRQLNDYLSASRSRKFNVARTIGCIRLYTSTSRPTHFMASVFPTERTSRRQAKRKACLPASFFLSISHKDVTEQYALSSPRVVTCVNEVEQCVTSGRYVCEESAIRNAVLKTDKLSQRQCTAHLIGANRIIITPFFQIFAV